MEFILISDSKIKVMLTAKDLARFELEADDLDYANTETKRMFWDVLSRAKRRTGFDTDGQKVVVQLYPSREGGCEIFVTKIGSMYHDESDEDAYDTPHTALAEIALKKKKATKEKYISAVFSFDTLEAMIALCRALKRCGYSRESRAYISDGERFYLVLSHPNDDGLSVLQRYPFILEFGDEESPEMSEYFLFEHTSAICKSGAVEALSLC